MKALHFSCPLQVSKFCSKYLHTRISNFKYKLIIAFHYSLGKFMDSVVWSIRGTYFAVIVDAKIQVFDVNIAGIVASVDCITRVTCLSFLQVTISQLPKFTYC